MNKLRTIAERIQSLCGEYNAAADDYMRLLNESLQHERFYADLEKATWAEPEGSAARELTERSARNLIRLQSERDAAKERKVALWSDISACWRRAEDICCEVLGESAPGYRYLDRIRELECVAGGCRRCISYEEVGTNHLFAIAAYLARRSPAAPQVQSAHTANC